MPPAQTCQFTLRVTAAGGDLGPEAVEEFALDLRRELADLEVTRFDRLPGPQVPPGIRGAEMLEIANFLLAAVQTTAAVPNVVAAIKRCAARISLRGQRLQVNVAGIDLDPEGATEGDVRRIVDTLMELPAQPQTEVRSALVVANSHYDDPALAQLRSPGHDADALARVLGDPAVGRFQVDQLMDADERTIRRRVAAFFADRDRDDLLLLHFSCHGVKDTRGRLHLAARDTDLSVLGATAIPASFINDLLSETRSRRVVLVLDCCYSGAFARGSLVRAGSEVQIADEFGAGSGRIVLTASSATEYAFEGGELTQAQGQPSAFTSALVSGLETGEADLDADGEISIDELYDYTYRTVRERTPGQAPMKWSFGVEGSLVIARSVRPAELPESILHDLASDRVVLRLEAVQALEQLLRVGRPGLQNAAAAALAGLRDHDDSMRVRQVAGRALGVSGPTGMAAAAVTTPSPAVPPTPPSVEAPTPKAAPPPEAPPPTQPPAATRTPPPPVEAPSPPEPQPAATGTPRPPQATPGTPPPVAAPEAPAAGRGVDVLGDRLLFAGGGLVLLSLLLYVVGAASADDWLSLGWIPEALALVLLLATRNRGWAAFLAGLLSWELLFTTVLWLQDATITGPSYGAQATSDVTEWPGSYGVANLVALAALGCLAVGLWRGRSADGGAGWSRWVAPGAVGLLSLMAGARLAVGIDEVADLDGAGIGLAAGAVLSAATLAFLVLAERTGPLGWLAPAGWLIGAGQLAVVVTIELHDEGATDLMLLWALMVLTAVVAGAVRTRPGPVTAADRLPVATGAMALLGVVLYIVGLIVIREWVWPALVSESWPPYHVVTWFAVLLAAGLLVTTREARWAGVLAGLLSWEWLYAALVWQGDLSKYFAEGSVGYYAEGPVGYFAGNVVMLAALGCALAVLLRSREPAPRERWKSLAGVGVAVLSVVVVLIVAGMMARLAFSDELRPALILVALIGAAVLPLVCLAAPDSPGAPYAAPGWLLGGVQFALVETVALAEHGEHTTQLVLLWVLLVVTAVFALGSTSVGWKLAPWSRSTSG